MKQKYIIVHIYTHQEFSGSYIKDTLTVTKAETKTDYLMSLRQFDEHVFTNLINEAKQFDHFAEAFELVRSGDNMPNFGVIKIEKIYVPA